MVLFKRNIQPTLKNVLLLIKKAIALTAEISYENLW